MSEPLSGIVAGHGEVATALVHAVEQISGITGALAAVSNTDCDRGTLEQKIEAAIDGHPAVIFVDLASGSCLFAALHRLKVHPDARVVTGVNLAMLLDFVFHREQTAEAAAARAREVGERAIRIPA
jgi:mannose/fructose-specific phosphotransferase system component IIA